MFQGDVTHNLIVNGHLVIHDILQDDGCRDNYTNIITASYNIGSLGRISRNITTAQFVGMLILRVGRGLSLCDNDIGMRKAMLCCACARICFQALRDPFLELHAVVASAKLLQMKGDVPMAARHLSKGQTLLNSVDVYFDDLIDRMEVTRGKMDDEHRTHDRNILQTARVSCITQFHRVAKGIYATNLHAKTDAARQTQSLLGGSGLGALLKQVEVLAGPLTAQTAASIGSGMEAAFGPGLDMLESFEKEFHQALRSYQDGPSSEIPGTWTFTNAPRHVDIRQDGV